MSFSDRTIILEPGEGDEVRIPGTPMTHKLAGADTGGSYSVVELTLDGSGAAATHTPRRG